MISSYYAADDIQAAGNPLGMQPNASRSTRRRVRQQPLPERGQAAQFDVGRAPGRVLSSTTPMPLAAAEMASAARSNA